MKQNEVKQNEMKQNEEVAGADSDLLDLFSNEHFRNTIAAEGPLSLENESAVR
ncbi:hypothetical protein [Bradyrhizobium macuxiense]|uniref:hypothetical protein n=1 Tax=Bradyrhizobium macuxiense TaxID=1755647 RepID=UPI00142ED9FC|nr:hypothetical protein [Bradyrhizobium macuxiense]